MLLACGGEANEKKSSPESQAAGQPAERGGPEHALSSQSSRVPPSLSFVVRLSRAFHWCVVALTPTRRPVQQRRAQSATAEQGSKPSSALSPTHGLSSQSSVVPPFPYFAVRLSRAFHLHRCAEALTPTRRAARCSSEEPNTRDCEAAFQAEQSVLNPAHGLSSQSSRVAPSPSFVVRLSRAFHRCLALTPTNLRCSSQEYNAVPSPRRTHEHTLSFQS